MARRGLGVESGLQVVDLQRGDGGGEAVHGSGGGNGHERDAQPEAEKAGHIIDGAGADRNGNITVRRLMDQQLAEGGFIKFRMCQDVETGGDTGLGQNFHGSGHRRSDG